MIDIKEYVEDLDLKLGYSKRMNCPNCNGYKTFTVTNNMGSLLWNCYKASCSVKGNTRVRLSVDDIKSMNSNTVEKKEFEFEFDTSNLEVYNIKYCFKMSAFIHKLKKEYDALTDAYKNESSINKKKIQKTQMKLMYL